MINQGKIQFLNCKQNIEKICRYCHNTSNQELIQPCFCFGNLRYSHPNCLKNWITQRTRMTPKKCQLNSWKKNRTIICQFCFHQIQFQIQNKWILQNIYIGGILILFQIIWNIGIYSSIQLFINQREFFIIYGLVLIGNITGFNILKKYFIIQQIVLKQQQIKIRKENISEFRHCCSCLQESQQLIKVCDCISPQRFFHKKCIEEQIKRYIEKLLLNKKKVIINCKYCLKQIDFEIKDGKLNFKKYIEITLLIILLLIWNIFNIFINIKVASYNSMFQIKIIGLYTFINNHLIDTLINSIQKDRYQKEVEIISYNTKK